MASSHLYQNFLKLPSFYKYLGVGSVLLILSTILPWYQDLDTYKFGDIFLGVTGPTAFVGIVVLLISFISFGIFLTHLLERKKIRLPVKESVYHLFVGIQTLFLLLLTNSIFFHPKFGVNIIDKETRFGMYLAFLGGILMTFGGYLQYKKEKIGDDLIGKLEPLTSLPEERKHGSIFERKPHVPEIKEPAKAKQESLLQEQEEEPKNPSPPKSEGGGSFMWKPY